MRTEAAQPLTQLETARLRLRPLTEDDAPFILALLNDPDWIRYIGDRKVRTLEDARAYLVKGPIAMRARNGFGLDLVERKSDGAALGLCGLIKRETLPDVDIGFAFLPAYRGQGYALEAAQACMRDGRERLGITRIVAIASPGNDASARLLGKLGLRREKLVRMPGEDEDTVLFS